jgi:DNA-binding transcriptional LysR family regulator
MIDSIRPDLNLLLALEALLAERNVTRAAARLNLSQPALSTQLRRLRQIFGDPLLVPARRGVIPTQRALELQAPLQEALRALRSVITERVHFDPSKAELTVAIAASDYAQCALLDRIVQIQQDAPQLRLSFRQLYAPELVGQMERGEVDLAIMTPDTAPKQLLRCPLFDERYVVIARHGHPIVQGSIDLDQLCALTHVAVSPRGGGFSGPTDAALSAMGRQRRVSLSTASFLIVPELIARSDQIALVPERLVRRKSRDLQILEPPIEVSGFSMGLVWHERSDLEPAQMWLRSRLAS